MKIFFNELKEIYKELKDNFHFLRQCAPSRLYFFILLKKNYLTKLTVVHSPFYTHIHTLSSAVYKGCELHTPTIFCKETFHLYEFIFIRHKSFQTNYNVLHIVIFDLIFYIYANRWNFCLCMSLSVYDSYRKSATYTRQNFSERSLWLFCTPDTQNFYLS